MQTFGIDISRWQKGISLKDAMSEGVQFAIIKAGGADAGNYKDSCFESFYKQASDIGLPVGAYFYANCANADQAEEEADYFAYLIQGKKFPLKCWYDIEGDMQLLSGETLSRIALTFCRRMQSHNIPCGVYANLSTFNKIDFDGAYSAEFPKWVAYWGKSKPSIIGINDIWQYGGETNMKRSNKVAGRICDQDFCYFDFSTGTDTPIKTKPAIAKPTLYYGSRGSEVQKLQKDLNYVNGANLITDGIYGYLTKQAVLNFQKKRFIDKKEHDGIYGNKTYLQMKEVLSDAD